MAANPVNHVNPVSIWPNQASYKRFWNTPRRSQSLGLSVDYPRLRHIRPDVRVVLTSGYDEADATGGFRGTGLAGFIQKPYTSAKLAQCIKRVFERATSADGD